jgi:putative membrane protein
MQLWPGPSDPAPTEIVTADEMAARSMVEKKSVINLLEAYAVSIKHYLRGEDGIYYKSVPFHPIFAEQP